MYIVKTDKGFVAMSTVPRVKRLMDFSYHNRAEQYKEWKEDYDESIRLLCEVAPLINDQVMARHLICKARNNPDTHSIELYTVYKVELPEVVHSETPKDILRLSEAWTLNDVVNKLIEASEILLHDKNYDGMGYEEIEQCVKIAKEFNKSLSKSIKDSFWAGANSCSDHSYKAPEDGTILTHDDLIAKDCHDYLNSINL